jgi:hypothetical protein
MARGPAATRIDNADTGPETRGMKTVAGDDAYRQRLYGLRKQSA